MIKIMLKIPLVTYRNSYTENTYHVEAVEIEHVILAVDEREDHHGMHQIGGIDDTPQGDKHTPAQDAPDETWRRINAGLSHSSMMVKLIETD
jgi:hypothetical protein